MKPLVVLASIFAAASAGIANFGGGGSGGFQGGGISGSSGGYPVGGNSGGGYAGGNNNNNNNGGYSNAVRGPGGGGFNAGFSNQGGFSGGNQGGFSGGNQGGYSGGNQGGGGDGGNFGGGGGGQIRKFVSVHVGPEEPQFTQTRVIRAGGAPDKHVNIIFVKAPSNSAAQQTEVILPEAPQSKTLVYVLVKKQESSNNVRVRGPAPTRPSKPEVYFIRYKDQANVGGHGAGPGGPGFGVGGIGGDLTLSGNGGGNAAGPAYGPPAPGGGPNVGYN